MEQSQAQAMEFAVNVNKEGDVSLLDVSGEVDVYTSPRLRSVMVEQFDTGAGSLVVNLDQVNYLDSSGLGILVAGLKRARENSGEVILANAKPRVQRVLEVTGLEKVFKHYTSVDEALKAAKGL